MRRLRKLRFDLVARIKGLGLIITPNPIVVAILTLQLVIIISLSVSMFGLSSSLEIKDRELESLVSAVDSKQERYLAYINDRLDEHEYDIEYEWEKQKDVDDDIEEIIERIDEIEAVQSEMLVTPTPTPTPKPKTAAGRHKVTVKVSQQDIRNIASLVYLECGGQSYRCQKAVASVIINRMMRYHKSATQVIWEPGVFSPAYKVRSTSPSSSCLKAVRDVVYNGATLPKNVVAFRNGHYHSFGRRYCCIDGVYFTAM